MARTAVALSGGGHRAALFGLGVLLYLVDAGKARDVVTISSVSGGSLTNGFVALHTDYQEATPAEFRMQVRSLIERIALSGTVWSSKCTWSYLVVLIVSFLALLGVWLLPLPFWAHLSLFIAGALTWAAAIASRRGEICGLALGNTLFSRNGTRARLDAINNKIDHVICATDLHAGEHVYFSGTFVCGYRFGWGSPGDLPLHTAVQASAAFPGAFPPRFLRTSRHEFRAPDEERGASLMALVDGGVYDNMADQWPIGVNARKKRWPELARALQEPDEVIVVNSSAGLRWQWLRSLHIPLLGELLALFTVMNAMYENTTSPRRTALVHKFDQAAKTGSGLKGCLVTIEQTPYKIADYFRERTDTPPERAGRADSVLRHFGEDNRAWWKQAVTENSSTATTLTALGLDRSASLLRHGYCVAMANSHVILGYPLREIPELETFRRIASDES